MKSTITLTSGRIASIESAIHKTHALLGRRNEEADRPDDLIKKELQHAVLTDEEKATLQKFRWDKAHGRYGLVVLEWAESKEAAEALKDQFPSEKWSSVEIRTTTRRNDA